MVQRRGAEIGGEAAELGRMAGEQEIALRSLVSSGLVPAQRTPEQDAKDAELVQAVRAASGELPDAREDGDGGPCDVRVLLAVHAGARVSFAEPGSPVLLGAGAAVELAAAVSAALDNVRQHAGEEARAWILLEDEPREVLVTVRDDGPGIAEGRLADAEREGRMGVALSIRGRLRDLGGSAELVSVPGQGTEVELRVPRGNGGRQ